MKSTPVIFALSFFLHADVSFAALPGARDSGDIALPEDSLTTTSRGGMTVCNSPSGSARKGLKFMQFDKAACPGDPQKAVGWDRPQVEPVSPGVPFQDQGIERF